MSDVAVIVLDINGGEMLRACLDSIAAQTLPAAELVVWDNSETNLGFAGGNNEAWTRTTAPFVALVNNDVVLDPDWLSIVREAMADDVAAVQTMIRASDGTIDGAGIDVSDGTIRQVRGEGTGHRGQGTGGGLGACTSMCWRPRLVQTPGTPPDPCPLCPVPWSCP